MEDRYGNMHTAANGFNSYEMEFEAGMIFIVATMIEKKFGAQTKFPVFGLDIWVIDFSINGVPMSLGWDIWSSLFIMADNQEGNPIVEQIADFLEANIEKLTRENERMKVKNKKK